MAMRTPGTAQLLDIWDAGQALSPTRRTLLLLAAAFPEQEGFEHWPLGAINRELIALRRQLFGASLVCLADCSACGEVVEIDMPLEALLAETAAPQGAHRITSEGCEVEFHLPTALDLLVMEAQAARPGRWLAYAVDRAQRAGAAVQAQELGANTRAAIEQAIEQADPLAHIAFTLACPACAHSWSADLHIIDVLWTEIGACARRVFSEVGRLAQAFGWGESDILAMSATRRNQYLEWLET